MAQVLHYLRKGWNLQAVQVIAMAALAYHVWWPQPIAWIWYHNKWGYNPNTPWSKYMAKRPKIVGSYRAYMNQYMVTVPSIFTLV